MSDAFTGFSEDEIRKLRNGTVPNRASDNETRQLKSSLKVGGGKKSPAKTNGSKTKKVIFSKSLSSDNIPAAAAVPIPEEAKLQEAMVELDPNSSQTEDVEHTTELKTPEKKYVDLEGFETRQKLIEEQNRRRKELLAKALADRTKRTEEEANRLNGIRNEFKKLDANLSNDVKILRQQIEVASVHYMEAQKKYDRIEKEFLNAKLLLQQKLEKKEMLTEHLCTIIEQNEERKARKLTELLDKLELTDQLLPSDESNDNKSDEQLQTERQEVTDSIIVVD